jgi:glycosyltransferase involved in cell wall biosynthesis
MRVVVVSGPRSTEPMGLELAERCLLRALRASASDVRIDVRVIGRRQALRHARAVQARWIPAQPNELPRAALIGGDLIHMIGLDIPPPDNRPFVATVHDLSPLHFDDEGTLPPWIDEVAGRARLLLTPSAFTAEEINRYLGVPAERIRVIGGAAALDARRAKPLVAAEQQQLGIVPPMVLRYGGYTARKNVQLLLDAWQLVPQGTLVLVGPPHAARAEILARTRFEGRVVVLDYVTASFLARLLRTASVLASTSLYEGFGLPPLEAALAGTPVVAASSPSVLEVCGNTALVVEPDAESLARGIRQVLDDEVLSQELISKGEERATAFSWNKSATAVLSAYKEAAP